MKNTHLNEKIELDHIGIAVDSIDEAAKKFWSLLGWPAFLSKEIVADQKVLVGMMETANSARVELLEPTDPESPIAKFKAKRGPGIHHICFKVRGIESILERLKKGGIRLINETPVTGAHGMKVAFIHPGSTGGVLVELSEEAL